MATETTQNAEVLDKEPQEVPAPAPAARPDLTSAEKEWRHWERAAAGLAKAQGGIIPRAFQGKPGDILAAMHMAKTYRVDVFALMRGMYFVNGKPSLMGDMLLAIARARGCKLVETVTTDKDKNLVAACSVWRPETDHAGEPTVTSMFSSKDAVQAGLWDSSDVWKKYPQRMLMMRARGFALRDAIPEYLAGVYIEGELETDRDEMRDVTPKVAD